MLTAAVRDLHLTYPGQFVTDVRTPCPAIWENNPFITPLEEGVGVEAIECEYPLIHRSNEAPYHFIHGFIEHLNQTLHIRIQPTVFRGDIHISNVEKSWLSQVEEVLGDAKPFWIAVAGGKRDFTAKWWSPARFQEVVDHFEGRILFVQVGEGGHAHPPLRNVVDLRGRTDLRQLIRLVYHAQGVLSPVTLLMHLAAAVEVRPGMPRNRPCVVIAGGREPPQWEAYPHHQFIHRAGALRCCDAGGCWKSRAVPLGDGDDKDLPQNLCVDVVGALPRCMDMITAADVIRAVQLYFEGGAIEYLPERSRPVAVHSAPLAAENRCLDGMQVHPEMPVEELVRLLERPVALPMPVGWQAWPVSAQAHRIAMDCFIDRMPAYPRRFAGRGIVVCAGGARLFTCGYVCARILRFLGCRLPIQFWHLGDREMDDQMRRIAAELGVTCIDAEAVRERHPARILNGWELKPFAMLHSSFKEVLLLDADNVSVSDPSYLFESSAFKACGAMFWPDYGRLEEDRPIWSICDVPFRDEPEIESGQILIDKEAVWPALNLAMWMKEHSDYYYAHIHGDKCTFQMAWHKLGQQYVMPSTGVETLDATMCQHDLDGRRIFQHRNMDKWRLDGSNRPVPGFIHEDQCRVALTELGRAWSGTIGPLGPGREGEHGRANAASRVDLGAISAETLAGRRFLYRRIGFDERLIQLMYGGQIGEGAADCERSWCLDLDRNGAMILTVIGATAPTFRVRRDREQGIWRGSWLDHERMAVELIPLQ